MTESPQEQPADDTVEQVPELETVPEPASAQAPEPATEQEDEQQVTDADGPEASSPIEVTDIAPLAELQQLAEVALNEIAEADEIGEFVAASVEGDAVAVLQYAVRVPGYTDWFWTVLCTRVPDSAPTVLECFMLPGENALLAPAWVPWAERLAEFRATHDSQGNLLVADENDAEGDTEAEREPRERVRTMARTRVRRRRRRDHRDTDGAAADAADAENSPE
ncbi:DUF3027 domain-containing protein [Gulosibacter bifidus]|uniref:DUF3027 domain-containing protein n=1 Tax=Gulosibacter bifidus TaxID=272239 RepID=A0ABW5RH46_9MICO|nr:DUF3027 domain-containing protein [Gulosibacter bifidus]